jgi:hypothetical protein
LAGNAREQINEENKEAKRTAYTTKPPRKVIMLLEPDYHNEPLTPAKAIYDQFIMERMRERPWRGLFF